MSERRCIEPSCNKPLVQKEGEGNYTFKRRVTCGKNTACGHRIRAAARAAARAGYFYQEPTNEVEKEIISNWNAVVRNHHETGIGIPRSRQLR